MVRTTIEELRDINVYARESNFNDERQSFDKLSDTVQYISDRILDQLMRRNFNQDHSAVADEFGDGPEDLRSSRRK